MSSITAESRRTSSPRPPFACLLLNWLVGLEGTGVTANGADPGFVRTNLGRDAHGLFKLFLALMRPFMASPEKGAQTSIYAAAESSIETVNGHIFAGNKCTPLSSNDEADAKRLWKISAQLTTL